MIKRILLIYALLLAFVPAFAQIVAPVKWSSEIKMVNERSGEVTITANIEPHWHLYGLSLPEGGPRPTQIKFTQVQGAILNGELKPSVKPVEQFDSTFNLNLNWWENKVEFIQNFTLDNSAKGCIIEGSVSYQACSLESGSCIAPSKEAFNLTIGDVSDLKPSAKTADAASVSTISSPANAGPGSALWEPADFSSYSSGAVPDVDGASWLYIFVWGFIGGLLALLTPCVWPMIPLTVSFFLKKNTSRRRSIMDAVTYGLAIIVIYLSLGLIVTIAFGASKLNDLATNAVFNLIFFALLVVFAISFFGAFEIKLPAKWSTNMDSKADRTTGIVSIFFMAFTLVLVSFSCTGPLIGTLLVEAASEESYVGPAIGMGAFALALAIPFTLFAIFPSLLKDLPRSGGWLNSVKVVLGFLELALSLKFLSVADLAYGWNILDREVFVSLWVVVFFLLGFYLLGKIRFPHDAATDHVGVGRFFLALVSLSFAVYLVPGLWGAPLKGVSAFVPPLYTQDFNLYESGSFHAFDNYDEGMAYAAENGRPVLIDFSGYGCVNCRKMEGAVFDTQEVSSIIKENFIMITLMVDDKRELTTPVNVTENGKSITLETVGELWSYLQRTKFDASTQPYYVMLDSKGQPLAAPYSYDENVARFVEWLESGLKTFEKE